MFGEGFFNDDDPVNILFNELSEPGAGPLARRPGLGWVRVSKYSLKIKNQKKKGLKINGRANYNYLLRLGLQLHWYPSYFVKSLISFPVIVAYA